MAGKAKKSNGNTKNEIVVFSVVNDTACTECGEELWKGRLLRLEHERALCMACADLDRLEFLPRGDAAVTRRASTYSTESPRPSGGQDVRRRHMLHQLVWPHEISLQRLSLAEELLGLVVPVAAFFVVALTQGDDRVRLGGIRQDDHLRRRLARMSDHPLAAGGGSETDGPRRGHADVLQRAAANWPRTVGATSADPEILTERDRHRTEIGLGPFCPLTQGLYQLRIG